MKKNYYCVTVRVYDDDRFEAILTSREATRMPLILWDASTHVAWFKRWFEKKAEAVAYKNLLDPEDYPFIALSNHYKANPLIRRKKAVAA